MEWRNKSALKLLHDMEKLFGKPTNLTKNKEGLAQWTKSTMNPKFFKMDNVFEEHLLRDEAVPHKCPKAHKDFFYSYIKVSVAPHTLADVLSLSGSVGYDPLKKLLSARCASLEANIATLKVATDIIANKQVEITINKEKYKYKGLEEIQMMGIYGKTIGGTAGDPTFVLRLYKDLSDNLQALNKANPPEETGYWVAAFSYKDDECFPPDKANKICGGDNKDGGKRKPKKKSVSKPLKHASAKIKKMKRKALGGERLII